MDLTPRWRPTARIFVVDPEERILLFSSADPEGTTTWWFTPGGAMQRGETLQATAVRELREETGYACTEAELGPLVATCAGTWAAGQGKRPYFSADSFFFLRVPHADIDTGGHDDAERVYLTGYRWWTLPELRSTDAVVWPLGLAGLLEALLRDGPPERPVRLTWALPAP
ncbi:MAG TPA: NUDIX domain-containing protein [Trebonia sp.]